MVLSDQEEENLKVKRSYVGKVGRVRKRPGRGGVAVAEVRGVNASKRVLLWLTVPLFFFTKCLWLICHGQGAG